jgi:DNA polymerase III subunit epsilon
MSFLALDFETATSEPTSACEIGVALVEGGRVTSSAGWLIKPPQWPYFQAMNVQVHGIRPADVAQSPTFAALWPELQRWFAAAPTLIAHNAAFDMKVLRASLAHSKLPVPNTQYACSVQFARRVCARSTASTSKTITAPKPMPVRVPKSPSALSPIRNRARLPSSPPATRSM